jgi:preprotein translocase subunit SecB
MKLSKLQLKTYDFIRVYVEANEKFSHKGTLTKAAEQPIVEAKFTRLNEPDYEWMVSLTVSNDGKFLNATPYKFNIAIRGFFTVDESVPADNLSRFIAANAPAMLYAPVREMLANIAARGPIQGRFLPAVTFADMTLVEPPPRAQRARTAIGKPPHAVAAARSGDKYRLKTSTPPKQS